MFKLNTRILIVDEMLTMRKLVSKACQEIGFTDVIEASDGAQAWQAIQESQPPVGLVISDWGMPKGTGIDLVRRIRADSRFSKLPFLMVTAEAEQHQVLEALKSGVDQYMLRPFTTPVLSEKLEQVHQKRGG